MRDDHQDGRLLDPQLQIAPHGVFIVDTAGRYLDVNAAGLASLGHSREELAGKTVFDVMAPHDHEAAKSAFETLVSDGAVSAELDHLCRDGEVRRRAVNAVRMGDGRFIGFTTDITEGSRAETSLGKSEESYRVLVESSPYCIHRIGTDGRLLSMNPAGLRMLDLTHESEVIGTNYLDAVGPEDRPRIRALMDEALGGKGSRFKFQGNDGLTFRSSFVPLLDQSGVVTSLLGISLDITEDEERVSALREANLRLSEISETIDDVFWLGEGPSLEEYRALYVNRAIEHMMGHSQEAVYEDPVIWMRDVHPDDRERVAEAHARLLADGTEYDLTFRNLHPERGERWIHAKGHPVYDGDRVHRVAGIARDVTDQRHAALAQRELEQQLHHAKKMEALGRLAGGVAHDFNNLLTVIIGCASHLLSAKEAGQSTEDDDVQSLNEVLSAGERAADLTRQLLALSRRKPSDSRAIDPASTLRSMDALLRRLIGDRADLGLTMTSTAAVNADAGELERIALNLVMNAVDAMTGGGRVEVTLEDRVLEAGGYDFSADVPPGHYVVLDVRDDGAGMAPEVVERMFEPFFTTKGLGEGTGLGLATVYASVRQAGGHLRVESDVGKGTTVSVFFPACEPHQASPPEKRASAPEGNGLRIVLCEDDAGVRRITCRSLEHAGYEVVECESGKEALETTSDMPLGSIALLITDVMMPSMNGLELADTLRERHPSMPVLFMSGYSDPILGRAGLTRDDVALLEKPFRPSALVARVKQVLEG